MCSPIPNCPVSKFGGQMIRRHQLHRRRRQNPLPVQLPAVLQHGRKPVVILGRRNQASAARRQRWLLGVILWRASRRRHHQRAVIVAVVRRKPAPLVRRNIKPRILHPQRRKNVLVHEIRQRLARQLLHDVAFHVHRHRVRPSLAGLVVQRNGRQLVDHLLQVL